MPGSNSDSAIEDEDTCPLCIEEFDLSDRNFKPCPCGYKVCQFCFNNIKSNMNGLCPACRRPYDEKTIQWKVVTAEEVAEFKANIQKNQKKRAQEQRLKEAQQRQVEKNDRKNLVGVRVVQKNLVYVTGLAPTVKEEELNGLLRKPEFFGQYGNILKISCNNTRKSQDGQPSLGIYVTFEKKEDAARCIQAVNGSQNGDRILRAQLGTTKYCSAWLRHEACTNRTCMFLHEQGEDEDSYTRQDLSSFNSIDTQRRQGVVGSSRTAARLQAPVSQPAPSSEPMVQSTSKDGSDGGDGSALPSSANWARNPHAVPSRNENDDVPSVSDTPPVNESSQEAAEPIDQEDVVPPSMEEQDVPRIGKPQTEPWDNMDELLKGVAQFCALGEFPDIPSEQKRLLPPAFDLFGGLRRIIHRAKTEAQELNRSSEAPPASDGEPETAGGSLALGGEPEDQEPVREYEIRGPPGAPLSIPKALGDSILGGTFNSFGQPASATASIGNRTTTPHQQLYSTLRSSGMPSFDNGPPGIGPQAPIFQQSHQRGSSRYNFATDGTSVNTVKVTANPRAMAQQASMMPQQLHSQPGVAQFYGSSIQGPPPGLKSSGTPPNLFHSFSGGSGLGAGKDSDMLHMLRRGGATGAGIDKTDYHSTTIDDAPFSIDALVSDPLEPPEGTASVQLNRASRQTISSVGLCSTSGRAPADRPGFGSVAASLGTDSSPIVSRTHSTGPKPNLGAGSKPIESKPILNDEEFPALDPRTKPSTGGSTITAVKHGLNVSVTPKKLPPVDPKVQLPLKKQIPKSEEKQQGLAGSSKESAKPTATSLKDPDEVVIKDLSPERDRAPPPPPVVRATPKTLKIISTVRTDTATPTTPTAATPLAIRLAAVSSSHRPETPVSEQPSDTASVMSGNVTASRTSSPAPSRSGLTGVRQLPARNKRKQRKEQQKDVIEHVAVVVKPEPEEIEPIIVRKKKQNKKKPPKANSAPGLSRPESPDEPNSAFGDQTNTINDTSGNSDTKEPVDSASPVEDAHVEMQTPTDASDQLSPAAVARSLVTSKLLTESEIANIVRPVAPTSLRRDSSESNDFAGIRRITPKRIITEEDMILLKQGNPIRKVVEGQRIMITPNGDCVRNMTEDEENLYLDLQKRVARTSGNPIAFLAPRHASINGFSLLSGRAVPNGRPPYFPKDTNARVTDFLPKVHRAEAIEYINQFVLPRLSFNSGGLVYPTMDGTSLSSSSVSPTATLSANHPQQSAHNHNFHHRTTSSDAAALNKMLSCTPADHSVEDEDDWHRLETFPAIPSRARSPSAVGIVVESRPVATLRARNAQDHAAAAAAAAAAVAQQNERFVTTLPVPADPQMSVEEGDAALTESRKEMEERERTLNQLIKRNKKLLLGEV